MENTEYIQFKICPFCASTEIYQYKKRIDNVWVMKCKICDLGFVEKYPKDLSLLYQENYFDNGGVYGYEDYSKVTQETFLWAAGLVSMVRTTGSIFDLGAGDGTFLDLAKLIGFNVLDGIEINEEYAEECNKKGFNVISTSFLDASLTEGSYDVVTAWEVLEHIPEINAVLQNVKKILKEDGVFFFYVPCLTPDGSKDEYMLNHSLEHIFYFSEKSLNNIFKHHFGEEFIGRFSGLKDELSSNVFGFVFRDKELTQQHKFIKNLLNNQLTDSNLSKLNRTQQTGLMIIYWKLYRDYVSLEKILNKIETISDFHDIETIFLSNILSNYSKEHLANLDYIEAKQYFLNRISYLEETQIKTLDNYEKISTFINNTEEQSEQLKQLFQNITQIEMLLSIFKEQSKKFDELTMAFSNMNQNFLSKDLEIEDLRNQLKLKTDEVDNFSNMNQNFLSKDLEIEDLRNQLKLKTDEVNNLSKFKVLRLRSTILYEKMSVKKILKIIYLLIAIITPEPIRKLLRPFASILKKKVSKVYNKNESSPEIKVLKFQQKPWSQQLPLVSIIIPCFNYGRFLEQAVDSVLRQTFQNFEIIIVNDGSTDLDTINLLNNFNRPKTIVLHQKNQGLVASRNNGIRRAKGKYICCLDADDMLDSTYLEKCLFKLEAENLDMCGTWIQEFGDRTLLFPTDALNIDRIIRENNQEVSAIFRKDVWKRVGGYNNNMIVGYEDWNLWISIAEIGGRGGVINEPLFLYRKHGRSMIDDAFDKHDKLVEDIKRLHPKLYSKTSQNYINKIKQKYVKYKITNSPYINLQSRFGDNGYEKLVLIALPFTIVGGADKCILELTNFLTKNKFHIGIFTTYPFDDSFVDTTMEYKRFIDEVYHLTKVFDMENQYLWKEFIFYYIESRNIDYLFIAGSDYFYDLLPEIKNKFPNLKVIDQHYNTIGHIDNHRKYRSYIDHTVVENEDVKEYLIENNGSVEQNITIIHNGVDVHGRFSPSNKTDVLLANNIFAGKVIISYIGRLSYEKGPDLFIEVAKRFKGDDRVLFVLAGPGLLYNELKDIISRENLEDKVLLPGKVDNIEYLSITDISLLTSRIDGRPNMVLESMSMGIPVVAPAIGDLPKIIKYGENGYLCEKENIEQFVTILKKLISSKKLRKRIGINARKYAEKSLDSEKLINKYIEVFQ